MLYRSILLTVAVLVACVGCQSSLRATSQGRSASGAATQAAPLKSGQAAPMFTLDTLDHKKKIDLASFTGDRPVLLMFGSYT